MASDELSPQTSGTFASPPPPPDPNEEDDDDTTRDHSLEPPDDEEIQKMCQRATDVKDKLLKGKGKGAGPEAELSDMVIRLTSAALSLRSQVLSQSDTIAQLTMQRKYLTQRMDEDRQLWDGERDNWNRVTEVLVAQANKASPNIYKEQEYGKLPALIESENISLRQRLANANGRLVALENELSHLRPILLMQPYAVTTSNREHGKKKVEKTSSSLNVDADATDATEGEPSTPKERKRQDSQGQYYRPREGDEREGHQKSRRSKRRSYFKRTPSLTDARAEHILLAARRIGRRRATMLSSITLPPPEPEVTTGNNVKGKGRANEGPPTPSGSFTPGHTLGPLPTTPKTPQTSPSRPSYPPGSPGLFPPTTHPFFVPAPPSGSGRPPGNRMGSMPAPFLIPGPVPGPAYAFYPGFAPPGASPSGGPAKSPIISSTAVSPSKSAGPSTPANRLRQQGKPTDASIRGAGATSPLTPLDKLLSAAQTVFSPSETPSGMGKRANAGGTAGPSDAAGDASDGSPTPKRRRVTTSTTDTTEGPSARLSRRTSALDVLADQAIGSRSADVDDSRSRSGSVSSAVSATSKLPIRGVRGRGRGRGSRARAPRKRKAEVRAHEEEEHTATDVSQGKAKSTSRRRASASGSRGSSLDPPINLSERRSRSGTPGSMNKRTQLRDIQEEDEEDAPHEVDDEVPESAAQLPQRVNATMSVGRPVMKKKSRNNKASTTEDDLGPESEEEDVDVEILEDSPIRGETDLATHQTAESDEVHKRWLQKLGLTGET